MKKFHFLLLIIATLALIGCGGDDDDEECQDCPWRNSPMGIVVVTDSIPAP